MKKIALAMTLAALSVAAARPAAAASYLTTWTGTLANGFDRTGEFGQINRTLSGLDFTLIYTINEAPPNAQTTLTATSSSIVGGPGYGPGPLTPVTATLTIAGHTLNFGLPATPYAGPSGGGATQIRQPHFNYVHDEIHGGTGDLAYITTDVQSTTVQFLTSPDLRTPFVATGPGLTFSGGFSVNNVGFGGFTRQQYAYSDFLITRVETTVRPEGGVAVPEPASWALMIVGFGTAGAMLRRRRAAVIAA